MLTFSNSFLWANCAASVHPHPAPVPIETERSDAQLEGEAAAWLANLVLRGSAASTAEAEGETAPNGWPIDYEMIRHVQTYCDLVRRHGPVESERDVELWDGRVRGRPDTHTVGNGDVLRLYELKYGYRIVEPQGNTQMLLGAIAFAEPHHRLFSLEVFQPRAAHANGPHRKWVLNADELNDWRHDLHRAMTEVFADRPIAAPGAQCEFCARRAACHALAASNYQAIDRIRSEHRARQLTATEIADELRFLEMAERLLKARAQGIRTEAHARIRAGEFVPGKCLDARYGNRALTLPPEQVRILTGIEPFKQVQKSPAELEKEGANPDVIAIMTTRPFSGFELTDWNPKKIGKMFDD